MGALCIWFIHVIGVLFQIDLFNLVTADDVACSASSRPRVLTSESDTITSPNHPDNYPNNANCQWLINPPGENIIILTFEAFNTESGYDYVYVYNGDSTSAPLLGRYSGRTLPPTLETTGGSMFLRFTSDFSNRESGFKASYFRPDPACSADAPTIITMEPGTNRSIASPNYPQEYFPLLNCSWIFQLSGSDQAEQNRDVYFSLRFNDFELEEPDLDLNTSQPVCRFDGLAIYDGNNLVSVYCGSTIPPNTEISSTSSKILFVTDETINKRGFNLTVSTVGAGNITTTTSLPTTPTGPSTTYGTGGTTRVTTQPTTQSTTQATTASPPTTINAQVDADLEGDFSRADGEPISGTCLSRYALEFRKSFTSFIVGLNALIGSGQFCQGRFNQTVTSIETNVIGLPDNKAKVVFTLLFNLPTELSFNDIARCTREVADFTKVHANWQGPIVGTPPGCADVRFEMNEFNILQVGYRCNSD